MPKIDPAHLKSAAAAAERLAKQATGAAAKAGRGALAAEVAAGLWREIDKEQAMAFARARLPKSSTQVLAKRLAQAVSQTEGLADREDDGSPARERAQDWRRRAVNLRDRFEIKVAKEKKEGTHGRDRDGLGRLAG